MSAEEASIARRAILGTDESQMDDKGRIMIGKARREKLGEEFVMCLGPLGNLVCYPNWHWEDLCGDVFSLPPTNLARQIFTRYIFGSAQDGVSFDGPGRLVVPQRLRIAAKYEEDGKIKVGSDVVAIGMGDRVEIWSKAEWKECCDYGDQYKKTDRRRLEIETALAEIAELRKPRSLDGPVLRLVGA